MNLRTANATDAEAIWAILKPIFRAGETYAIDSQISRDDALAYWMSEIAYVAEDDQMRGTFYIRRNNGGGGAHVCNCGFATAQGSEGRGVARAMLAHAMKEARARGYLAMQFNFVLENNQRAIDTWIRAGFVEVGRLPRAFRHPRDGFIDALVLHRDLTD